MDVQFSNHAIERVCGRMAAVVGYGEVQSALTKLQLRNGDQRVCIKTLPNIVEIKDSDALGGKLRGNKVYALLTVRNAAAMIDTIVLGY